MAVIPNSWTQLRQAAKAGLEDDLYALKQEAKRAAKVLNDEVHMLTMAITGSAETLARVFAVGGAELARTACYLSSEAIPRILSRGDEAPREVPAAAMEALSYIALLRCLSVDLPKTAEGVESRWLAIIAQDPEQLNDWGVRSAALACVAAGQYDLAPGLTGGGPLKPRTKPRQIAGPNILGLARHLAEVVRGDGGSDAVEGPWHDLLTVFPLTLASNGVRWIDLVWTAIALMAHFEKRPQSEVGTWLPGLIAELD